MSRSKSNMPSFALNLLSSSIMLAVYAGQVHAASGSCATSPVTTAETTTCTAINNDVLAVGATGSITTNTALAVNALNTSAVSLTNDGIITTSGGAATIDAQGSSNFVLNNNQDITNTGGSYAVVMGGATNFAINNAAGGTISSLSGAGKAIHIRAFGQAQTGQITNDGTISGIEAISFVADDSNDSLSLINNSGASITGTTGAAIFVNDSGSGRITLSNFENHGTIASSASAGANSVYLGKANVTNFTNTGSITATGDSAVVVDKGDLLNFTNSNTGVISNNNGLNATASFVLGSLDGTITNDGQIENNGSGHALYFYQQYATPASGHIINSSNGTLQSSGDVAVEIVASSNLANFTNGGEINGDFIAGSSNAIQILTINGVSDADFNGKVDLVGSGATPGIDGGSVAFNSGALLDFYTDQHFLVNKFNLSGGTLQLDPTSGTRSAGSSSTVSVPTIEGDFNGSGGTISLVIVNNSSFGKLAVDGDVDLNNTTMAISVSQNGLFSDGNVFNDVITSTTGINYGSFSISDNSALFDFNTVRNANDLDLQLTTGSGESSNPGNTGGNNSGNLVTAVNTYGMSSSQGIAPVMQGFANAYANNGTTNNAQLDTVVAALGQLSTDAELAGAVDTLTAASNNAGQQAVAGANQALNIIGERTDYLIASAQGLNFGDTFTDRAFWIQPFGSQADQDTTDGVAGYDVDSWGLVFGFDGQLSPTAELGIALSTANSNVDSLQGAGGYHTDVKSYQLSLYGSKELSDSLIFNGSLSLGKSGYDTRRSIFNGSVASSSYDSKHGHINAELEKHYSLNDKVNLAFTTELDYHKVNVDSYTETGAGALNLNVAGGNYDSLVASIGGKATYAVSDELILFGNASIGHDFLTERSTLTSSLVGGGASFTTQGIEPSEQVYKLGLGTKYSNKSGTEFSAKYSANARDNFVDHTLSANIRVLF